MRPPRTRTEPPLYDPRHEHDACGVGFVADAGGRSAARVLPLALAGLAALGHRGAFAADGESSDGAGVSLPLEASLRARIGADTSAGAGPEPAVLQLFAPRGRVGRGRALALVERALAAEGLSVARWRTVPSDPATLGREAASARPAFVQAVVGPAPKVGGRRASPKAGDKTADGDFDLAILLARRRLETWAREQGLTDLAVASASRHSIVYKGLVAGGMLSALFPDLEPGSAGLPLTHALFHQRYATNTRPVWRLAQPFRFLAHNGEINTVRGNREQVRGRAADRDPNGLLERILATGPLLSPDGSDSLSLDEAIELLVASGWPLPVALLAAIPEALAVRRSPHAPVAALRRRTAGFLVPWDGPAAIVFSDGRRVGAMVDRNGLRPATFAVTSDRLVGVASEAGAVPLTAREVVRRGRLGPGEMLLVDPERGRILEDAEAKSSLLRRAPADRGPRATHVDGGVEVVTSPSTPPAIRYLAGLDAERLRLDIRTMVLEGHEPLWSMGDDTPTPGQSRLDRRVVDHLRQSFAQVTNPPIDPERERIVMDLKVDLGRRPPLLGGRPSHPRTLRLERPVVADLDGFLSSLSRGRGHRVQRLDATWDPAMGSAALEASLVRLREDAVALASGRTDVVLVSDRDLSLDRPAIPSVLAVGAVHAALTDAGQRGRLDIVAEAGDVLDVHSLAMLLAAGASVVHPWLAVECAAELAGTRGAEEVTPGIATERLLTAFDAGLRKTLARMGIGSVTSYIGAGLVETMELDRSVVARCLPASTSWPGSVSFADLARRQLRRLEAARAIPAEGRDGREVRLPDPGLARFRGDGELHLFSPRIAAAVATLAGAATHPEAIAETLARYRAALDDRAPAVVRDGLEIRPTATAAPLPLEAVEPARSIVRRFVVSAMSVGALSPEAHRALTIGIQRAGGAANTGEGGEDPAWYAPDEDGGRLDAKIKQVASARFGVTATYLARAEQLEIKMAQGSKPGEGGQLPGRKATPYIAALRRGQPDIAYVSPPPHHDIYSIEDLAQLIADLRAIDPRARIGVKLVASRGVGTIAAGVAKAGADYIHLSGHVGGTGASPLSSIKHVGAPWELGLAEVHQVLLRNDLRDRVALRIDGGLRTGRDLLIATLLGAEEFAFGTAMLVALGCDMARQCHLDTCPTGIATQREDLRAKFTGAPEQVERFATALAEDLRRELAAVGAASVGEVVGESARILRPRRGATFDLRAVVSSPSWAASTHRRADPATAASVIEHAPASPLERRLAAALHGQGPVSLSGLRVTTADRSFGAGLSGALERGEVLGPVRLELDGTAGQSFGAFAGPAVHLRLVGQANDYVAKGLSGGRIEVVAAPDAGDAERPGSLAGNTCLYGATGGRLHIVGRAGMRFAVRNAGGEAVVEGIGPHGAEYMTGGTVVVLGPVGANFGAGMTGGRAFLYDPAGRHAASLNAESVTARRLGTAVDERIDGRALAAELLRLVEDHASAGSGLARRLLVDPDAFLAETWLVEPRAGDGAQGATATSTLVSDVPRPSSFGTRTPVAADGARATPDRNLRAPAPPPNPRASDPRLDGHASFAIE
jgi:glutamate synthase domain-containing protein 2/glutamate synthase domain-containing protein 1/glutamate synthase domain-containing protein 3